MNERAKTTSAEHARGSLKEAIGKLTGDARLEAEGRTEKRRTRPPPPVSPRD
ncbi:MAG TPA: CsbD family protein [Methylobacterium sp.]|uniref:CsbD family protein n=1 Tax=Methylorubrum sp. B1-46 TaxID=2897334 RepID=UPI001E3D4EC5|nr:CsbD family protein [Methylorubrum sp. B1-46]UGB26121.1 CsbD family protein [Methylorubrum sp. B1-46]HEV2543547.1 CsbD family protein [Methylobacterium sp.]